MAIEHVLRYVRLLLLFVAFWVGVYAYNTVGCRKVEGDEMAPSYPANKLLWLAPREREAASLDRGDVVQYAYPGVSRRQSDVVARVVAVPGDRVKIVKGEVFVNGEKVPGASSKPTDSDLTEEIIVPCRSVFVLCDKRKDTARLDSRHVGPVGQWALHGRVR